MENMTTPAVYHNDSSYHNTTKDEEDEIIKNIRIMSAVIFSVVCVLGVSGNGVVIWATGFRMKKTVSTVWYLNLAVADFLTTAILPLQITYRALDDHWPFGWFTCKMDGLVFIVNMYASVYTLVLISADRCASVVCPVWTRNHRTVRKASWVSLGVWALALAPSIPHVIFSDAETLPSGYVECHDVYAFTTIAFTTDVLAGFVVPFSVIVSCYSVIVYRLRSNRSLASKSGRSFRIIAAVIAAFFLCWIPFHVVLMVFVFYDTGLIEHSATLELALRFGEPIALTLALLNSCLNPLLYAFSQGFKGVVRSRSILKVLEKAFAEESSSRTGNTPPAGPVVTKTIALTEMEGSIGS